MLLAVDESLRVVAWPTAAAGGLPKNMVAVGEKHRVPPKENGFGRRNEAPKTSFLLGCSF